MKITKQNIRKIVLEEALKLLREYEEEEEWAPGEYLEIEISGDGYNRHIIKTPLDDYENQISSMYTDVKALVQILQVAPPYED